MMQPSHRHHHRGAALLLALLTVALISTLAVSAYWQQWRSTAIERADRQRSQALWILNGALDWARLILREDARASTVDHLAEPWAVPLQETRLSSFLNTSGDADPMLDAFLSGSISDEQAKLNLRNLVDATTATPKLSPADAAAFDKLFHVLGLPTPELQTLESNLVLAWRGNGSSATGNRPLQPLRYAQLAWLGLSPATLQTLAPYATWLPQPTPLNLNTASASTLYAALPGLDMAQAQALVNRRDQAHFNSITDVGQIYPALSNQLSALRHSVNSKYFMVQGQLRLEDTRAQQRSLVLREGTQVRVVWSDHHGLPERPPQPLQ